MGLTYGQAPFSSDRGSYDVSIPMRVRYWEPWSRRMRAVFAGATVLDSRRGVMVHETDQFPEHYYPLEDLDAARLLAVEPSRRGRKRWSVRAGDRTAEGAVIAYAGRADAGADGGTASPLDGFVTIKFGAMDRWFEEDDAVYAHLRDPYHRVDVRSSSRHVVVRHGGEVVADSSRPKLLFETGMPTRYYVPFADVDLGRLERSDTVSECPYKGDGQHWHLIGGGDRVVDAAWSLPHPLPEGAAAIEHVCFYAEKVDVEVDGERVSG